jgi:hypothetical protein
VLVLLKQVRFAGQGAVLAVEQEHILGDLYKLLEALVDT